MAKRGENIYKRKDNRWEGRIKIGINAGGRTIYKSVYALSYSECKEKLRRSMREKACDVMNASIVPLFQETCRQWLASLESRVKESTWAAYHYIVRRYLLEYFKTKKITEITKGMAEDFITTLLQSGGKGRERGLSSHTVHNIFTIFRCICKFAEAEYSIKNEVKRVKAPKIGKGTDVVLSKVEWGKISKYLETRKDASAIAVAIAMYTGMRIGEVCALRRENIDFSGATIEVKQTIQRIRTLDEASKSKTRLVLTEPKSKHSVRKIPLTKNLMEKLQKFCDANERKDFILGIDGKSALEPRTLQYRFKKFLKQMDIRDMNFHALRHSFATRCIENCMDVKSLSEILGHSSIKMTLDRYVHSSLEFKRKQINLLE